MLITLYSCRKGRTVAVATLVRLNTKLGVDVKVYDKQYAKLASEIEIFVVDQKTQLPAFDAMELKEYL